MKEKKYHIVSGVYSQTIGDGIIILDMHGEEYFGLNKVGTLIWQLLEKEKTYTAIHHQLIMQFDEDPQSIGNDIKSLLEDLIEAGLIEEVADR